MNAHSQQRGKDNLYENIGQGIVMVNGQIMVSKGDMNVSFSHCKIKEDGKGGVNVNDY